MREKENKRHVMKRAVKGTAALAVALALVLQPCSAFTAQAYYYGYDGDYPYEDDPDYNSYYWDNEGRKVTSVTRKYDDGTKYTAEYKYDANGHLVQSNVKKPDGSSSTMSRVYNGDVLISDASYKYDGTSKTETAETNEYAVEERVSSVYQAHSLTKTKYADGTSESVESWYAGYGMPSRIISVSTNGITYQEDYTYNERRQELTLNAVGSDGSVGRQETQYDEEGEILSYSSYVYDASEQSIESTVRRYEGEGSGRTLYLAETWARGDSGEYKKETWRRITDMQVIKTVSTDPDGSQTTENYTYNLDGDETLYTKTSSDGTTQKRETTNTGNGTRTVSTDGRGNTSVSTTTYDKVGGLTTEESTYSYEDGSTSYRKQVYRDNYTIQTSIYRDTAADGTETYSERMLDPDGGSTTRTKDSEGIVSVTKSDAQGSMVSSNETRPDGTATVTTWEKQEDGRVSAKITRYSDGTQDRVDYEYDANGNTVRETETRRSGVAAVTETLSDGARWNTGTSTITFNNGYQVVSTVGYTDESTMQFSVAYSVGDIAQDILIEKEDESIYVKVVHRDGGVEEASVDITGGGYEQYEALMAIGRRYEEFLEQAWNVLPQENQEPAVQ